MQNSQPEQFAQIAGWFDFHEVYDNAVAEATDGDVFVEVGSFFGKSACYMAEKIRQSGKRLTLFCVDHFRFGDGLDVKEAKEFLKAVGGNYFPTFLRNTAPYRDIVIPVCGTSCDATAFIPDGCAAFIFIDASHDEANVRSDIAVWSKKLKPGGMLAGHDFDLATVRKAVEEVFPERVIAVSCRSWLSRPFDDLAIFANWYRNQRAAIPPCPFDGVRRVGAFSGLTIFRQGPFQVQMWSGPGNEGVEEHRHPGVDTIQVYLSGQVYLKINGVPITPPDKVGMLQDGRCNFNGQSIRIRPTDTHSFQLGPMGGSWLTIEKWLSGEPTSTELDWEGESIDEEHRATIGGAA